MGSTPARPRSSGGQARDPRAHRGWLGSALPSAPGGGPHDPPADSAPAVRAIRFPRARSSVPLAGVPPWPVRYSDASPRAARAADRSGPLARRAIDMYASSPAPAKGRVQERLPRRVAAASPVPAVWPTAPLPSRPDADTRKAAIKDAAPTSEAMALAAS